MIISSTLAGPVGPREIGATGPFSDGSFGAGVSFQIGIPSDAVFHAFGRKLSTEADKRRQGRPGRPQRVKLSWQTFAKLSIVV
ncbi:hypothetical protein JQ596_35095 [Bradyrhizobium manausense]|uniref:hypothetical protein n=1 Tax=Bradyrhizobium TaxID=374 RepID=UPI001BAD2AFA|nr:MULTISPECIES: hypothetical protein [Bradyrhizobium]MBR0830744.1 hypothetical protein [Bradyrhizobium manausense]UVO28717.1 hypothetical protein KUF59_40810 [Bradyrhizobium arachidis]